MITIILSPESANRVQELIKPMLVLSSPEIRFSSESENQALVFVREYLSKLLKLETPSDQILRQPINFHIDFTLPLKDDDGQPYEFAQILDTTIH